MAGNVQITADYFPSLLYPEDGYDQSAPEENLLKSPLLAAVRPLLIFCYIIDTFAQIYRAIVTGPRTAKASQAANTSIMRWNAGKKSIAKTYAISEACPATICYIITLVQYSLFPRTAC